MRPIALISATILLGLTVTAQQRTGPYRPKKHEAHGKSALDKPTLEAYLRRVELWPPNVNVAIGDPKPFINGLYEVNVHLSAGAAAKDETYYVSADGKKIIRGTTFDIDQKPFQHDLDLIKTVGAPSFGPANAPLTLVVFSDFECPICREEAKSLRENVPKEFPSEVRVVFKNYPLPTIHPWAVAAAIAGRCVFEQKAEAFWAFHDWIYDKQPEITADNLQAKVLEWAKSATLDTLGLQHCIETRATEPEVNAEIADAKRLNVEATPTLFLNGRRMVGQVPWQNLSQIIRLELQFLKQP
jgi:protein-disulfide isomerase